MKKVTNIKFSIDEGAIEFSFNNKKTAYLQLPDTGDSQHQINELDEDKWTDIEREIFKQLEKFYFDSFEDAECAAASARLCKTITDVKEVNYKGQSIYVTTDEDNEKDLLVESAYRDYYNKTALFDLFEHHAFELFGYDEEYSTTEIIKLANN